VQYCPEDDIHFPSLTVDQTLTFAAKVRAPQSRVPGQSRATYVRETTDMYTTVFGLTEARHTRIGDAAIRGISGGEKKRVSISEVLATRSLITSWDKYVFFPFPSSISSQLIHRQLYSWSGFVHRFGVCPCSSHCNRYQ
jgi:ABC-type hemin transport system ATPase subunit